MCIAKFNSKKGYIMKKIIVAITLMSGMAWATSIGITNPPTASVSVDAPTYSIGITNSIYATNIIIKVNGVSVADYDTGGTVLGTNVTVSLVNGDNIVIARGTNTSGGVGGIAAATATITRTSFFNPYGTNTTYTYYTVIGATTNTATKTYSALTLALATNAATYATFKSNLVGVIGLADNNGTWPDGNLAYQIGDTKQAIATTSSYWYGQRVILYNGLYTNYVNNEPLPNALLLTQLYYAAHNVEALRIRYTTFENDSLYSCPGLRMGHVGVNSDSTNRYPVVLPAFGTSETNDYLMIVWPSSYSDQVFHNGYPSDTNIYHRVFDASLVQYFETNNAVYTTKTVAVGAAAYGIFGSNKVEIILVSTNGSDLSKFQLGSASARPWWIYANGRDFSCYTNNVIGNYTNNVNQPALSN